MKEVTRTRLAIPKNDKDHPADAEDVWNIGNAIAITRYWNGEDAPPERHAVVRIHWSDEFFYVRFDAVQAEPLIVSDDPKTDEKTHGLWDRDVCELFIAPDPRRPKKYYEFETAPTGEWIDLLIEHGAAGRTADLGYASGFVSHAAVENDRIVIAMKIGWKALGGRPSAGDIMLGNFFRCVGKDPGRGYLAWQPTFTPEPNFHVPTSFAELVF
jgi:hypothetical protein